MCIYHLKEAVHLQAVYQPLKNNTVCYWLAGLRPVNYVCHCEVVRYCKRSEETQSKHYSSTAITKPRKTRDAMSMSQLFAIIWEQFVVGDDLQIIIPSVSWCPTHSLPYIKQLHVVVVCCHQGAVWKICGTSSLWATSGFCCLFRSCRLKDRSCNREALRVKGAQAIKNKGSC